MITTLENLKHSHMEEVITELFTDSLAAHRLVVVAIVDCVFVLPLLINKEPCSI